MILSEVEGFPNIKGNRCLTLNFDEFLQHKLSLGYSLYSKAIYFNDVDFNIFVGFNRGLKGNSGKEFKI